MPATPKIFVLVVAFSAFALGQADRAAITGTLRDPSGAAIVDGAVAVGYMATGQRRSLA